MRQTFVVTLDECTETDADFITYRLRNGLEAVAYQCNALDVVKLTEGGLLTVVEERVNQMSQYGEDNDNEFDENEMAIVAALLASPVPLFGVEKKDVQFTAPLVPGSDFKLTCTRNMQVAKSVLPHNWRDVYKEYATDRKRALAVAGAFIMAELDRLERLDR